VTGDLLKSLKIYMHCSKFKAGQINQVIFLLQNSDAVEVVLAILGIMPQKIAGGLFLLPRKR
jgi:hypothetical protein